MKISDLNSRYSTADISTLPLIAIQRALSTSPASKYTTPLLASSFVRYVEEDVAAYLVVAQDNSTGKYCVYDLYLSSGPLGIEILYAGDVAIREYDSADEATSFIHSRK